MSYEITVQVTDQEANVVVHRYGISVTDISLVGEAIREAATKTNDAIVLAGVHQIVTDTLQRP